MHVPCSLYLASCTLAQIHSPRGTCFLLLFTLPLPKIQSAKRDFPHPSSLFTTTSVLGTLSLSLSLPLPLTLPSLELIPLIATCHFFFTFHPSILHNRLLLFNLTSCSIPPPSCPSTTSTTRTPNSCCSTEPAAAVLSNAFITKVLVVDGGTGGDSGGCKGKEGDIPFYKKVLISDARSREWHSLVLDQGRFIHFLESNH